MNRLPAASTVNNLELAFLLQYSPGNESARRCMRPTFALEGSLATKAAKGNERQYLGRGLAPKFLHGEGSTQFWS